MFRKARYDPVSFTPTGNCKIIWTNFERTRSPDQLANGRIQRQRNREIASTEAIRTTVPRLLRQLPPRISSSPTHRPFAAAVVAHLYRSGARFRFPVQSFHPHFFPSGSHSRGGLRGDSFPADLSNTSTGDGRSSGP